MRARALIGAAGWLCAALVLAGCRAAPEAAPLYTSVTAGHAFARYEFLASARHTDAETLAEAAALLAEAQPLPDGGGTVNGGSPLDVTLEGDGGLQRYSVYLDDIAADYSGADARYFRLPTGAYGFFADLAPPAKPPPDSLGIAMKTAAGWVYTFLDEMALMEADALLETLEPAPDGPLPESPDALTLVLTDGDGSGLTLELFPDEAVNVGLGADISLCMRAPDGTYAAYRALLDGD